MKGKKHLRKNTNLLPEEKTIASPQKETSSDAGDDKKSHRNSNSYSYTKKGDKFTIFFAGFFAFIFLMPGISIGLAGEDTTAALVTIIIGLFPLKFIFQEIYTKKTVITKTNVEYIHTALFKKTISWKEPLAFYCRFAKHLTEEEDTSMLWHSYDDSKNILLHTSYYKSNEDTLETFEDVNDFLKGSTFCKKIKPLHLREDINYEERNFFDVYNQAKSKSINIKRFLFPDKHIKVLKDEPLVFSATINYGYRIFFVGLCLLVISFLMLPIVYKIGGAGFWCFAFHLSGILFYNFGTSEQTLKLEKRTLSIGKRYFKRKIREKEFIPFANITSVNVMKHSSATEKGDQIYYLKIFTENSFYEFGRCSQKEELEWLAEAIEDRIIKINDKFFVKPENSYY